MSIIEVPPDGTVCEILAEAATKAVFELADFRNSYSSVGIEPVPAHEFPRLRHFLESAAAARIKYPKRMERLDALYYRRTHQRLVILESDLFGLLSPEKLQSLAKDREFENLKPRLHAAAKELFLIDAETKGPAQEVYQKTVWDAEKAFLHDIAI